MPARMNPRDWDRLFRPNTPRRGGPLWAFTNVLIVGIIIGVFVFGLRFALQYNTERVELLQATQVAQSTAQAATAVATQTAEAGLNATAVAAESEQATLFAGASGMGNVIGNGGNLRSEPVIAPETVLGQVCPGDEVALLEEQSVGTAPWYRIRVVELSTAPECQPARRIPVGNEGWISSTLIGSLRPVPVTEPADAAAPDA